MKRFILLTFIALSGLCKSQISNSNLIAHYPFNGNSNDISGNLFNATSVGSSGYVNDRNGNANGAFNFNGSDSYFLISNANATFKPTTYPVSISAWVKLPSDNQRLFTIFKNDFQKDIYSGIRITVIPNGTVTCGIESGGNIGIGSRRTKTGVTNIKDNQWHLITCIIRGATDMDIYIGCVNDGGSYSGSGGSIAYGAQSPGIIGAYDGILNSNFNLDYSLGAIDDLRFFKRELNPSEICTLVNPPSTTCYSTFERVICEGQSVTYGGQTFTTDGVHTVTVVGSNGCDSIITVFLAVNPRTTNTITRRICAGESVTYGDRSYNETGRYPIQLPNTGPCVDNILDLTVTPRTTNTITRRICAGESVTYGDRSYNETGRYPIQLPNTGQCVDNILDLTVKPNSSASFTRSICAGQQVTFGGQNFSTNGTFTINTQSANGCDSTITLNLTILTGQTTEVFAAICEGESYTLPGGRVVTAAGDYTSPVAPNSAACAGSIITHLIVNPVYTKIVNATFPEGGSYELPDGLVVTQPGTYPVTLETVKGCDSTVVTKLSIVSPPPSGCYATIVNELSQGLTKLGTMVNPERSIETNALGAPDGQSPVANAPVQNFVSLGFGGHIDLQFAGPIANGPGPDIKIWESSSSANAEQASIEVSQDGLIFVPVGTIGQGGVIDFGGSFSDYVNFIRITDISNPAQFGNVQISDGFDVDAVECLNGPYVPPACIASSVFSSEQKFRKNGSAVIPERSSESNATGTPDGTFYSLGFGGEIILDFGAPVANGDGDDIRVTEITYGYTCATYPEKADVFASLDGVGYVYLGRACQTQSFDLGTLGAARYIKIIDVSDVTSGLFPAEADGYDVDAIECLNGPGTDDPEDPCFASEAIEFDQHLRKNGTAVVAARSDKTKATGLPQGDDTINFASLGFGGSITLKFNYVIFNNLGNDIKVIETSFGNPHCARYPERARVHASFDQLYWEDLGQICLDGERDLGSLPYAQYIRITDESNPGSFNGSADGFDVDAVVVINGGCFDGGSRIAGKDNVTTADETSSLEMTVYPNPADEYTIVSLEGASINESWKMEVIDAAGRVVSSEKFVLTGQRSSTILNTNTLARGIYMVVLTSANERLISRLVK